MNEQKKSNVKGSKKKYDSKNIKHDPQNESARKVFGLNNVLDEEINYTNNKLNNLS